MRTLFVKRLALKQDNEKNQIVLGAEVAGLTTIFPAKLALRAPSQSELKRKSDLGRPITEAALKFFWMDSAGNRFRAPATRLIDYFQYPEARLSGFLSGCAWAPRAIRRDHQHEYGQRVLVLGSNFAGEVVALLLTQKDDPLVSALPDLSPSGISNVLGVLSTGSVAPRDPGDILAEKLRTIVAGGWYASVRNKGGTVVPFKGNQGAGYTLESLLGVATNSAKEPDILGYEIKSFRGDKLSLMTPTADGGPEGALSFREFMKRYGLPAKKNDGSLRFTGVTKAGAVGASGLSLRVAGYDDANDVFARNPDDIRVEQFRASTGEVLSSWSLQKLADCWNAKHALAAYVEAEKEDDAERYRFRTPFYMCEGTDVWRLLRAIARGTVYYDPVHTIYASGEAKVRPQWRVGTRKLEEALSRLYVRVKAVT